MIPLVEPYPQLLLHIWNLHHSGEERLPSLKRILTWTRSNLRFIHLVKYIRTLLVPFLLFFTPWNRSNITVAKFLITVKKLMNIRYSLDFGVLRHHTLLAMFLNRCSWKLLICFSQKCIIHFLLSFHQRINFGKSRPFCSLRKSPFLLN